MKKKKLLCTLMAMVFGIGTLAGCAGNGAGNDAADTTKGEQAAKSGSTESEEPYNVTMSYIYIGSEPTDLKKVEAALSELTLEKINCTVTFKPVQISNRTSQYNLWAASGEKIDLLCLYQADLGTYVNEGKVIELTDYKDILTGPNAINEERGLYEGGMYNNILYAVPAVNPALSEGKAFYTRKDILDEVGYEAKDIYTYEDLDKIMEDIQAAYPDMTVMALAGPQSATLSYEFLNYDTLGVAGGLGGVLIDATSDDTTVVNLFESKEYYEYLEWMQRWYKAGYISREASSTSDSSTDWIKAGRCAGFKLQDNTPGNVETAQIQTGFEMVQMNIKKDYVTTHTYDQIRWAVTTSSENPQKALEFLNLMYTDADVLNLIKNGIEGDHYIKNGDSMIVTYPDGINGTNTPYNNPLGLYGDKRIMYMFAPNQDSFYEESEAFTKKALESKSPALGYVFDSSKYQTEIAAINSVIDQYISTLEYGMADNLESTYAEFIKALDTAGMNRLVEENQKQLDAWLALQ